MLTNTSMLKQWQKQHPAVWLSAEGDDKKFSVMVPWWEEEEELWDFQHRAPFIISVVKWVCCVDLSLAVGQRCRDLTVCSALSFLGLVMRRPSVKMWVIWELANTVVVSTGPCASDSRTTYKQRLSYSFIWHMEVRDASHKHSHKDSLFQPTQYRVA